MQVSAHISYHLDISTFYDFRWADNWKHWTASYQQSLWNDDLNRMSHSAKFSILLPSIPEAPNQQLYLTHSFPIHIARLIVQFRINNGYFYYARHRFDLSQQQICTYCNSYRIDDLEHFLLHCKYHNGLRQVYINQYIDTNLSEIINHHSFTDQHPSANLTSYLLGALKERKFLDNISSEID